MRLGSDMVSMPLKVVVGPISAKSMCVQNRIDGSDAERYRAISVM